MLFRSDKAKLRRTIRQALCQAGSFDEFSSLLLREGVTVPAKGNDVSFPDISKAEWSTEKEESAKLWGRHSLTPGGGAAQAVHPDAHEQRRSLGGDGQNITDDGVLGNRHDRIPPFFLGYR